MESLLRLITAISAALLAAALAVPAVAQDPPAAAADPAAAAAYHFAVGKALAAEGDLAAAVVELRQVAQWVPDDPWVRLELATALTELAATAPSARLAAGQLAEAERQAREALALAPDNLDAWRILAQARLAGAGDDATAVEPAVEALERVLAQAPDDARTAFTLARVYLGTGRAAEAVLVLQRLRETGAASPFVERMLAQALLTAGRNPEGEEALARVLADDPGDREARYDLSRLQAERGDHEAALATLDAAPADLLAEPAFRQRRALELYFLDRLDEALATIDEVIAEDDAAQQLAVKALILGAQGREAEMHELLAGLEADVAVHRELAGMLEARGAAATAEEVLRRLLARLEAGEQEEPGAAREGAPPMAAVVRDELARLLARTGRPAEGAEVMAPLLRGGREELRTAASLAYADLLHQAGRTDEALALLDGLEADTRVQALTLDLLLASGRERRAQKLMRRMAASDEEATVLAAARVAQGNELYELSIPVLEELAARSGSGEALFSLAAAYERTGRVAESVATFRRLLAAHPDDDRALNYLGYLWVDRGENLDEALRLIRRAVAASPGEGAYVDSLGWAHYRLGDYELALKYLQRAAHLVPDDPEVYEHLGDVHHRLGDARRAREFYLRAAALAEGGDVELRRKLDALPVE